MTMIVIDDDGDDDDDDDFDDHEDFNFTMWIHGVQSWRSSIFWF